MKRGTVVVLHMQEVDEWETIKEEFQWGNKQTVFLIRFSILRVMLVHPSLSLVASELKKSNGEREIEIHYRRKMRKLENFTKSYPLIL